MAKFAEEVLKKGQMARKRRMFACWKLCIHLCVLCGVCVCVCVCVLCGMVWCGVCFSAEKCVNTGSLLS